MQFSVTFRHMEATEALKDYARERMERIKKYFPDPIAVHVVMSTERGYSHRVDVSMQLHNGLTVAGHEASENMYASLDQVTAKIERQVRRYKEKLRTHKSKTHLPSAPWSHTVVTEGKDEPGDEPGAVLVEAPVVGAVAATDAVAATGAVAPSARSEVEPLVVKREQLHASSMSVSESIMQLNLQDEPFLVFRHDETGRVNVVYRRDDGSYGLIETMPPEVMQAV